MAEAMTASADKVAGLEGALHGNLGNVNSKAAEEGGRKVGKRAVMAAPVSSQGFAQFTLTQRPMSAAVSHLAWAFGTELVIA
jgi:hypothetical protein